MPRGRGFRRPGRGMGRTVWGIGRGMGNPYPFCRRFPWLPRRWWTRMYGTMTPYQRSYTPMPYSATNFRPFW